MKTRLWVTALVALAIAGTTVSAVSAQTSPTDSASAGGVISNTLFTWATEAGGFTGNWRDGLALGLAGFAGALVAVYFVLGDFLPSMGGKAEYDALKLKIEGTKEKRDVCYRLRDGYAQGGPNIDATRREELVQLSRDYDAVIARDDAALAKMRGNLVLVGTPIFLVLGAVVAAAIAQNVTQAIAVGFGWTAVVDRLGIQRDAQARGDVRKTAVDGIVAQADASASRAAKAEAEIEGLRETIARQGTIMDKLADKVATTQRAGG